VKFDIKYDTKQLTAIAKQWKKNPYVKVGILSGKDDARQEANWNSKKSKYTLKKKSQDKITNTEIAFAHEFGFRGRYRRLPERSFLRMPIQDDFQTVFQQYAVSPEAKDDFIYKPNKFLKVVGELALQVIDDAFANGGSSKKKWDDLSDWAKSTKKVDQILVETGQLRDSISYEIVNGGK